MDAANRELKIALQGVAILGALLPTMALATSCITGGGGDMEKKVRREEAFRTVQELNSRIMNSLDKVILKGKDYTAVQDDDIDYVLSKQLDQNNMQNFVIENFAFPVTNATEFKDIWTRIAANYSYRKRNLTSYTVLSYKDESCLREMEIYALGTSFGIMRNPTWQFPPWRTSKAWVDFDRFRITWREVTRGDWRVVGLFQFTESSFPMPDGAQVPTAANGIGIDRSPYNTVPHPSDTRSPPLLAPGNYEPSSDPSPFIP